MTQFVVKIMKIHRRYLYYTQVTPYYYVLQFVDGGLPPYFGIYDAGCANPPGFMVRD